jgi:hypothetical protein
MSTNRALEVRPVSGALGAEIRALDLEHLTDGGFEAHRVDRAPCRAGANVCVRGVLRLIPAQREDGDRSRGLVYLCRVRARAGVTVEPWRTARTSSSPTR